MNELKRVMQNPGRFIMGPIHIISPQGEHHSGMEYQTQKHRNSPKAVHVMQSIDLSHKRTI